uniref:Uncharacterized protein LOC108047452 n=1 Tax=Drosophila rhopaloa TaxID=1041015 RepID=A0A6P4FC79_DRORH
MSDRKERSWQLLLLLICFGLIPAEVIANSIPHPCQNGQAYVNGACSQVIVNVFNGVCGGQTGIACNPVASVVVPGTPACPNAPLNPIEVPSVPGIVPGTPACPNAPLNPIVVPSAPGIVPGTPACPNTPLNPIEVPSVPTPACPNAPLDPIVVPSVPGIVPGKPSCPNAPLSPTVCPPANCNQQTQCPNNCPTNCPNTPCPTTPPTLKPTPTERPYPPPPPYTTQPPDPIPIPAPPPDPITRCPDGTILVKGACRLLYCGGYGINAGGRCVQARCPAGYVWTGIRCSKPKPVEIGNIHIENYVQQKAGALPHLVTKNVNNVKVNASIAIQGPASEEEEEEEEKVVVPQPPSGPCCNVVAPRICTTQADQVGYKCFSRSQQQCGSFCSANKVVLTPPAVATWTQANTQMVVMPPNWAGQGCQSIGGICQQAQNFYDCSGCAMGDFSTCSSYCYSYKCSSHNCAYYDQTEYCSQYPGQIGCRADDGWFPATDKMQN